MRASANAPDTLIRFTVSNPLASTVGGVVGGTVGGILGGATGTVQPISVNFHLAKDDAYVASNYGTWSTGHTNDPTP